MKYTRRSDVVDVTIWNTHGDHPAVHRFSVLELNDLYDKTGGLYCSFCHVTHSLHGYIDMEYGSLIVCPGDRILKTAKGNYLSYHKKEFKQLFRKVKPSIVFETESKKDTFTNPKREGEVIVTLANDNQLFGCIRTVKMNLSTGVLRLCAGDKEYFKHDLWLHNLSEGETCEIDLSSITFNDLAN